MPPPSEAVLPLLDLVLGVLPLERLLVLLLQGLLKAILIQLPQALNMGKARYL